MSTKTRNRFSLYRYIVERQYIEKLKECRWWQFANRRTIDQWRDEKIRKHEEWQSRMTMEEKLFKQRIKAIKELNDIFADINALKPGEKYVIDENRIRVLIMFSGEKRSLREILDRGTEHFKITNFENFPEYRIEYIFERKT